MFLRKAEQKDKSTIAELALLLWPGHAEEELHEEITEILKSKEAVFFLAFEGEAAIGFSQCQLRHDYVEGTNSSPVGASVTVPELGQREGLHGVCQRL